MIMQKFGTFIFTKYFFMKNPITVTNCKKMEDISNRILLLNRGVLHNYRGELSKVWKKPIHI